MSTEKKPVKCKKLNTLAEDIACLIDANRKYEFLFKKLSYKKIAERVKYLKTPAMVGDQGSLNMLQAIASYRCLYRSQRLMNTIAPAVVTLDADEIQELMQRILDRKSSVAAFSVRDMSAIKKIYLASDDLQIINLSKFFQAIQNLFLRPENTIHKNVLMDFLVPPQPIAEIKRKKSEVENPPDHHVIQVLEPESTIHKNILMDFLVKPQPIAEIKFKKSDVENPIDHHVIQVLGLEKRSIIEYLKDKSVVEAQLFLTAASSQALGGVSILQALVTVSMLAHQRSLSSCIVWTIQHSTFEGITDLMMRMMTSRMKPDSKVNNVMWLLDQYVADKPLFAHYWYLAAEHFVCLYFKEEQYAELSRSVTSQISARREKLPEIDRALSAQQGSVFGPIPGDSKVKFFEPLTANLKFSDQFFVTPTQPQPQSQGSGLVLSPSNSRKRKLEDSDSKLNTQTLEQPPRDTIRFDFAGGAPLLKSDADLSSKSTDTTTKTFETSKEEVPSADTSFFNSIFI